MIKPRFAIPLVMTALTSTEPARADFRLQATPSVPPVTTTLGASIPPSADPQHDTTRQVGDEGATSTSHSRFKVAYGFGQDVPLAFATKQIVPASVAVRFGPGVDKAAMVTWKGDGPWNRVLAAAVKPLRLRLTTGKDTLLISH